MTDTIAIPMPPLPRERARTALVQMLNHSHTGAASGIGAAALAAKLQVTERTLRQLVSDAREDGVAIAGTPTTGYYIAETPEELQQCCAFLRARAMHSLRIEAQLSRKTLADLLGQLQLPA